MSLLKFKYVEEWSGNHCYDILHNGKAVGEIAMLISYGELHIYNVVIDSEYRGKVGFGDWLRTFETIRVYDVLPDSVDYWRRRKAEVVNIVTKPPFMDIEFIEGEEDE